MRCKLCFPATVLLILPALFAVVSFHIDKKVEASSLTELTLCDKGRKLFLVVPEVSFTVGGYTYSVFDEFNGEEKPAVSEKGLTVTSDTTKKEVKYLCQGKAASDFADLPETFENSAPQ